MCNLPPQIHEDTGNKKPKKKNKTNQRRQLKHFDISSTDVIPK